MKKLMLLAGAALVLGACAESPTAPAAAKQSPGNRLDDAVVCRSGYIVAYDENGNPYCAPALDAPQATVKQAPKG